MGTYHPRAETDGDAALHIAEHVSVVEAPFKLVVMVTKMICRITRTPTCIVIGMPGCSGGVTISPAVPARPTPAVVIIPVRGDLEPRDEYRVFPGDLVEDQVEPPVERVEDVLRVGVPESRLWRAEHARVVVVVSGVVMRLEPVVLMVVRMWLILLPGRGALG